MDVFRTLSILTFALFFFYNGVSVVAQKSSIQEIYQFGDSISDTGNTLKEFPGGSCGKPPYGETFFHHPTGRCCDGRLIVDFFAQAFGLPFLSPYLDKSGNFTHGVNFAVAGSTALDLPFLAKKNIRSVGTPNSLLVQCGWFKSHLATICKNPTECKQKLKNALFIVGGVGGNDFNSAGLDGMKDINSLTHDIIQAISNAVKGLIDLGATRILVPGSFPTGCQPFSVGARNGDPSMYDDVGCSKGGNAFATFYNDLLKGALATLQKQYPGVKIVYGDYFNAMRTIFQNAASLGFDKNGLFEACCIKCGAPDGKVCPNPSTRVSWDGLHLTEHAYQVIANHLLKQIN